MRESDYDLILAGGGLASGLAAFLIRRTYPAVRLLVIDAGRAPDWDQTWSFSLGPAAAGDGISQVFQNPQGSWLAPFLSGYWPRYEVRFPKLKKVLNLPYASIRYQDFRRRMQKSLGADWQQGRIQNLAPDQVTLDDGRSIRARCVIDARGWEAPPSQTGFQKFVGLHLELKRPHGLAHPILMDATVPQQDGFRFMYVLPWDGNTLLIEDTHYSRTEDLNLAHYEQEIRRYAEQKSWEINRVIGSEQGILPIPCFGQPPPSPGVAPTIGVRAGLYHPTTGYSIHQAVQMAEWLVQRHPWSPGGLQSELLQLMNKHWQQQEFFRRLNNMLFFAGADDQRYRILEKFYEHDETLIARFYAGRTTARDKIAILSGRPPVPLRKGLYHFFHRVEVNRGAV